MNFKKNSKKEPYTSPLSKSLLLISNNYQIDALFNILKKNPNLVNTKDQKNETFLSYAIKRKNTEIAELILTSPLLDYSYQDNNGNSYLHLAVINQLENIIRTLIKKGINVNIQNNDGNTALHFAYSTGDIKFISIIVESKVDTMIKNKNGLIAEDISPGTFPEILDINNNYNNNVNITHNKNNTVTINLNVNNNENNNKENDKDNEMIINDRGQINKSIKINWEQNSVNNNKNNSKTKLKYSLVNCSYSEDDEEERENGIISYKPISKSQNDGNDIKHNIKSSDIFDLTSSISYQEKVENASFINAQVVGEPNVLIKKDSPESGINEDMVNMSKIKTIQNNLNSSSNNTSSNNFIINGINMNEVSFQTAYGNGRNINISQVNYNNENGLKIKSNDFRNENMIKRNGQNFGFDHSTSISKKQDNYNQIGNDILNNQDYGRINNYENNNNIHSNIYRPEPEINQDFVFSPFTTLKEPLNKKTNGIENNLNNSNKINILNNQNSTNINNININNKNGNKNNINNNSQTLKRSNALNNNNLKNVNNNKNIKSNNNYTINESNFLNSNNTDLSQVSQNNKNSKKKPRINLDCPISLSQDTLISSTIKVSKDPLLSFLSEIRMEKYYDIMNSSGFDDIQLLINQTKKGITIKDKQLKEAGINIPGDRAKILIRLQEKAGNFVFPIPKEVYYVCQNDNIKNDRNINKLRDWLQALKIEIYLENFIKNGYHSIELMLLQMESKNPLTDEILKDELGINKIGHRSRIINKLIEEGKSLNNKLKTSMLIIGNGMTEKICDCMIY